MKKAQCEINLNNDTAKFLGQTIQLQSTSTGHYCIDILGTDVETDSEVFTNSTFEGLDDKERKKRLEVVKDCESCYKHKKPSVRPAVELPRASDFNDVVAVDLHKLDSNLYYLHIIDEFSRFSAGCIVDNKRPQTFVGSFIKYWISIHGAPKRLYTDYTDYNSRLQPVE
ncbi:hypothetical protein HOLleu_20072 [Holothuria leucospilota]|uniref:Integrase catalytic domain-containing protein n=1 Tax=Holothuria leucospilota TaxID=206669 RepID=A0A9Q1H857_HOLLE|nr:hypothetical protein HOLleu_20072 [Holothuria leucospilota]